ncbi:hypothetical protein CAP31_01320 [Sulfuriferula sp. AH1]|nr:hypothetical protein CAP31_01320 [Sulfuriferula sp. AH1]
MKSDNQDTGATMNIFLKTAIAISSAFMLMSHAQADETPATGSTAHSEPGVVAKVERAVEHGAKAAATGVEHGVQAAGRGLERSGKGLKRGGDAAGRGINRGVEATKRAVGHVTNKIDKSSASSSSTDK